MAKTNETDRNNTKNGGAKRVTIGILAHVDAGKTTLSEAMLYLTGEIRKAGRVDHGDAFLDDSEIERNRGITIFSKQARMTVRTGSGPEDVSEITLIDTPGHVDFSAEMERALSVIDYGLLVISGSEGVQAHTRTLHRMLRDRGIPAIVFINKMDITVRSREDLLAELSKELGEGFVDFTDAEKRTDAFIDDVTLYSPELADIVLNDESLSDEQIAEAVRRREIVPCVFGSALKMEGVSELLGVLGRSTLPAETTCGSGAIIYKIANAEDGEKICFMKVTGGEFSVRDKVAGHSAADRRPSDDMDGGPDWEAKINQIRLYSGSRFTTVESVSAGSVCAVTGLADALPGDSIGDESPITAHTIQPYMTYTLSGPEDMDPYLVMKDISQLAAEDPALNVRWREETRGIEIRLMGQVQLEVLTGMIRDRFGYDVTFGAGSVLYLETVSEAFEGVGHFEPLRHYAEVHLIVEPGERGSGIVITSATPEDELARNWQRLILTHIEEKEHIGVLTGSPLTDVKITLAAGKAHDKHTNGGDFREATYRAVRNALMQARAAGKAVLLEPWLEYDIELPSKNVGRAMTDIRQMGGTQDELEQIGDLSRIRGRVPAAGSAGYQLVLAGYTSGEGRMSCTPAGYDICHDAETVTEAAGYDPERDVENTADSVFVSHGASDIVRWDKVREKMHLPSAMGRIMARGTGGMAQSSDSGAGLYGGSGNSFAYDDDGLDVRERARRRVAAEKELRMIFERTYGTSSDRVRREARSRDFSVPERSPEEEAASQARNQEIRAKHERKKDGMAEEQPTVILVDGYNLIHADKYLKELSAQDMGSARDQLLDRLSNYAAYLGEEMIVIFDAYKVPYGMGSDENELGLRVIFTEDGEPADIRIGQISDSMRGRRVYVVSSDSLIQQDIFTHGALRISSKEFIGRLAEIEEEIRRKLDTMKPR